MAEVYHCIVAGAGPAGLAAAVTMHRAGVPVLVLEKNPGPGSKPCGGGLTPRANLVLDALGLPVSRGLGIRDMEGNSPPWHYNYFTTFKPMMSVVHRNSFNRDLLAKAQSEGVRVVFAKIKRIRLQAGVRFSVDTDKGVFQSRTLVGADGAASLARRAFGGRVCFMARALMVDKVSPAPWPGRVTCDGWAAPMGYGWVFPHDDKTANAGVYTIAEMGGKELRLHLDAYLAARLGPDGKHGPVQGGMIPWGGYELPRNAPVILAGDAGGFADPLTGEGIYHALETGRAAARAVVTAPPESARAVYEKNIRAFLLHVRLLRAAAPRAYKYPRQGGLLFGLAPVRHLLCEGLIRGFSLPVALALAPALWISALSHPMLSSYTHRGPMPLARHAATPWPG